MLILCSSESSVGVAPLHPWVWPEKPWKRIHLDFVGPLDGRMNPLVVDLHSKWPEIWEMKSNNSQSTISVLKHLFSLYGLPEQIATDNGPQFSAQEFSEFLKLHGVKHYRSTLYHPATNEVVERLVKTFKAAMRIGKKEGEGRQDTLFSEISINSSPSYQYYTCRVVSQQATEDKA